MYRLLSCSYIDMDLILRIREKPMQTHKQENTLLPRTELLAAAFTMAKQYIALGP